MDSVAVAALSSSVREGLTTPTEPFNSLSEKMGGGTATPLGLVTTSQAPIGPPVGICSWPLSMYLVDSGCYMHGLSLHLYKCIMTSIGQMRTLRLREGVWLAQSHTAKEMVGAGLTSAENGHVWLLGYMPEAALPVLSCMGLQISSLELL